jgi:GrpB-like predicted nucleotidyltransferase (UPF0157 family)
MDETPITIDEYDPRWQTLFEQEQRRLQTWIGEYTGRIEHVGSTAVPGLGAKPIIDITAVVTDLGGLWGDLDKLKAALGYELSHIPSQHLYLQRLDETDQMYNLHLIRESNELWRTDLLFREFLRANPDTRAEYEAIKREAAEAHPNDLSAYNRSKRAFIESVVERARADDSTEIQE